ncbi:4'-phosphopantetheinyl transferase superfamily protein [Radiobacillus kanasensis]|uniref:4'-phosphopantetheinyl transferase family protein n=1 Tax=Radiobacillus kanasensis TaxID=2844358 RepID=UPI001E3EDF6F|nr:4'-phosphopantetheinyl transferase superfamily protein [Radiobacillus kanasensis]UFU01469.1 4'-phosphopantetheinyl transferase superfamily protein [Radiobacillus kanasensis]
MLDVLINKSSSKLLNKKVHAFIKGYTTEDLNCLHKDELDLWESNKRFLRNGCNWVAGRITAKYSIIRCLGLDNEDIKLLNIKNRRNGSPYLFNYDNNIRFSIAHCRGIGFSCSSSKFNSIGCDIEKIKIRHHKFPNFFLCEREKELWLRETSYEDIHTLLTIAWSSKEACYKCLSSYGYNVESVFDIRIHTILFEEKQFKFSFMNNEGIGYWDKYSDFVLSVAVKL